MPLLPAGPSWCAEFPTSKSLDDLVEPFRSAAKAFVDALEQAGADVVISATHRPRERAYLMHWCCYVAGFKDSSGTYQKIDPSQVPSMDGVDIDWTCGGNPGIAMASAMKMRTMYGIVCTPVLDSRHTQGLAVDMTIKWTGNLEIERADGTTAVVPMGLPEQLWPVGASYGVIKLASDPPHWSSDGR